MKHSNINILMFLILSITFAVYGSDKISEEKYKQIEDNLLIGLASDNTGLKISCAYFLGEMKSNRSINQLLKILKSSEIDEERIIAALSLSKIKSEQSIYAVKQRIIFDDSERVQRLCEIFYNNYLNELENKVEFSTDDRFVDLNMTYNGVKLSQFASK